MKINLIRLANCIDTEKSYLKDSQTFIEDINNELFEYDHLLVENEKDAQFSIIFIETGGSEQKFKEIFKDLKEPIVLLSNSMNNSLPACFEIKTFLEQNKKEHTLLFGNEKTIAESIDKMAHYTVIKEEMNNSTLGVIGKPSDWLIASIMDYKTVKERYGITLIDIDIKELIQNVEEIEIKNDPLIKKYSKKAFDIDTLNGAIKIYRSLKLIIKKYKLKGLTVRCFDLLGTIKNTACLAFAILNEEGIVATCEGDVPTLLTMYFLKLTVNQIGFQANPSKITLSDNNCLFSHCTVPLNMCNDFSLMTHFESGLGIGVRGTLDCKEVTIMKIAPNFKDLLCVTGKIVSNTTHNNYCRTQIVVNFEGDEIYELLRLPFGNHVVIVYGDIMRSIFPFLQLFKFYPSNI